MGQDGAGAGLGLSEWEEPVRKLMQKETIVKRLIVALGGNLLSGKLSDSISLLSLSKINLSEWDEQGKGDESCSVLICFSADCHMEVQAPFIYGKGAGDGPACASLLHSSPCSHISIPEQKPSPAWENGTSAQSMRKETRGLGGGGNSATNWLWGPGRLIPGSYVRFSNGHALPANIP